MGAVHSLIPSAKPAVRRQASAMPESAANILIFLLVCLGIGAVVTLLAIFATLLAGAFNLAASHIQFVSR
jgi:UPF0716 family protein affecting phage T7 exclusion